MLTTQHSTIYALITAAQTSAVHVHRLSGDLIFTLLNKYIVKKNKIFNNLEWVPKTNEPKTTLVWLMNEHNEFIDEVLITAFKMPYSYTGENVVEISSHGNLIITAKIQKLFQYLSIKQAAKGEFSFRAFTNGKMNLAKAEAINELIISETEVGVELANKAIRGDIKKLSLNIKENIIKALSYLELNIDFSEEEITEQQKNEIKVILNNIKLELEIIIKNYNSGQKIKTGLKIALIGMPNVGKSTLFNSLLREHRAIVTHIAGTTRDIISERLIIENKDFILYDTAGIRHSQDMVEQIGITKTHELIHKSDIICLLVDINEGLSEDIFDLLNNINNNQKIIVVFTKDDIYNQKFSFTYMQNKFLEIKNIVFNNTQQEIFNADFVSISQNNFHNLENLLIILYNHFSKKVVKDNIVLLTERQKHIVQSALNYLHIAIDDLFAVYFFPEKVASMLNLVQKELEGITGEIIIDNIYDKIFSNFCVGK